MTSEERERVKGLLILGAALIGHFLVLLLCAFTFGEGRNVFAPSGFTPHFELRWLLPIFAPEIVAATFLTYSIRRRELSASRLNAAALVIVVGFVIYLPLLMALSHDVAMNGIPVGFIRH